MGTGNASVIEAMVVRSGGLVRASEARRAGVGPRALAQLVREGRLERVTRGIYRVPDAEPCAHPDFVTVALRVPDAVICLVSALAHHDLTTQIPRMVDIALPRSARAPQLDYPPLHVYWMTEPAFSAGVEVIQISQTPVRIYHPAKCVADAFKFRNRLGTDIAVEALREYLKRRDRDLPSLRGYARICRVQRVMQPYLEALLE
ncbi:MAG: type IV toxin-antitoxin system AbiEi family antitoxin domain-containing protein [Armatimonadetes bacterium]|nr:type IV toxin-antitoxin system AbiEi family antitoxin domain-containing protein [Armatimonadota bacterium]